jgi:hypothetical protein
MVESMQGIWIMELPELQGFSRSDVNDIKAFISAKSDKTRLAYHQQCKAHRIATIRLFQQNIPFLISLVRVEIGCVCKTTQPAHCGLSYVKQRTAGLSPLC